MWAFQTRQILTITWAKLFRKNSSFQRHATGKNKVDPKFACDFCYQVEQEV